MRYKTSTLIWILTPFVFSFAFGLDIYIPVLPQMIDIFQTTPTLVQLTMSLFLFTTGAGQLFIGPLSDQLGRKPIFYLAAILYALGSLGCVVSGNITTMIACRFVSSLGACGMLVTGFALVRDLYASEESARIYSFLNGAIGISPTFAPILGGYLAVYFGWQSVFVLLALIGVFAFVITRLCIVETLPVEARIKMDRSLFKRYLTIFTHPQFVTFALIAGLAESVFFCFFSTSPFIIIDLHGVPTEQFGFYFAVFGSVIGLGGFAGGKLIEKVGISGTVTIGIGLMFAGGSLMLLGSQLIGETLTGFLVPMALACLGAIFLVGSSASAALEPFGDMAGTASAGFGAVEFGLSALAGSLLMLFPTTTTVPYAISILLMAVLTWLLFSRHKVQNRTADKSPQH